MIIRITQTQKDFLINNVLQGVNELNAIIERGSFVHGKLHIDMDNDSADEIRDLCSEMLQFIGFSEDYVLNKSGEQLEELIDVFCGGINDTFHECK